MRYIPLTAPDRERMLRVIGASSVNELFADIPEKARPARPVDLPGPMDEEGVREYFEVLAAENRTYPAKNRFLGAGAYSHHVPSAVDHLISRSEFFTAYTPYQPEVSQGTLMAIYEFQTYTAALFEMEVANASMYDGASALAEAVIMAARITGRNRVVISNLVHPHWLEVTRTYTSRLGIDVAVMDCLEEGAATAKRLAEAVDGGAAAAVVGYPNFLGNLEDLEAIRGVLDKRQALMITAVAEPVALLALRGPGAFGADIVVGEGRSFGGSLSFGGPGLGLFATRAKWARQAPGRLVGKTVDKSGRSGYVLTLATREQHIRRERATSNICSNQALMATAFAIHLTLLGKEGGRELALKNHSAARYMVEKITSIKGFSRAFDRPFFNEAAIKTPVSAEKINERLAENGILGGYDLSRVYPEMGSAMLFAATEVNTKESIDRMTAMLPEFGR
ncbi:MAG: aminomethyl-transferring glycine dehydrogenase subunit GcvPA [Candidatus Nitrospinota bacterium M3_3B_026]